MSMKIQVKAQAQTASEEASFKSSGLQRVCNCSQHISTGGKCDTCRNASLSLQRNTKEAVGPALAQSKMYPLDHPFNAATPYPLESRFGYDFSQVPIYSSTTARIQEKLAINQPGGQDEQEADRIAQQVIHMPDHISLPIQVSQKNQLSSPSRSPDHAEQAGMSPVSHDLLHTQGQPLDPSIRNYFEPRFGYDFSRVRIHNESSAHRAAANMRAEAFTVNNSIAFANGRYAPETPQGRVLLAHELTHVIQQGTHPQIPQAHVIQREPSQPGKKDPGSGEKSSAQTPTQCTPIDAAQWNKSVKEAKEMKDINQKGEAMARLVAQALCQLNLQVHTAGSSKPDAVDPADYQQVPTINFDVRLNDKTRWKSSERLTTNAGYNFTHNQNSYVILGPNALNEVTLLTTQQFAQHELFMVSTAPLRPSGESKTDVELATWTHDFRNYFHRYLPLSIRPRWERLIDYYQRRETTDQARQTAITALVDYYRNPPPGIDTKEFRQKFAQWMRRESGRLIDDLDAVLHLRSR